MRKNPTTKWTRIPNKTKTNSGPWHLDLKEPIRDLDAANQSAGGLVDPPARQRGNRLLTTKNGVAVPFGICSVPAPNSS